MSAPAPWVRDDNAALFTDLYQLTMLQAYWREGMNEVAVFDLFSRSLRERNYLLACGLDTVLHFLETLRFTDEALDYLATLDAFEDDFLDDLADYRFAGDVYAVPEGTPVFPDEPIVEVVAPIQQAQLVETFLLNQITYQTNLATKARRVVEAAQGRTIADFGMRRMHAADAPLRAARAGYIAGVHATSNVLAGHLFDIPVTGTMAHSYVEAHDREMDAFRAFAELYPETTLLVDTYDTLDGVRKVVDLAEEWGDAFRVAAIRLDSGDLADLARQSRQILDAAGLDDVQIFASGSLNEYRIAEMVEAGAPIDGFGVGTRLGTIADQPYLDTAYKLCGYAGEGRMKLSTDKSNLPGRKQLYRVMDGETASHDVIALHDEPHDGEPLLECVMRNGERTEAGRQRPLDVLRERTEQRVAQLPDRLRALDEAEEPYEVRLSEGVSSLLDATRDRLEQQMAVE
ncbi:MAG: nicotinate phosphoribosyltransferase [Bacteroidetes bacterium]|jgi:nicotinate phosphoribosyltransferase|nr:nicotinate phosphoribosyltransferase [Bacteroidota bacterium]